MGKVKAEVQNLIDKCYALYEKGGSHAVIMYINEAKRQGIDPLMSDVTFEWCKACESHMPSILGECLVCGQPVTPKERVIMYGDRIDTVGQLRHIMKDLDDHDQICIETIDLETGDVEDLYPMSIDVIDGIKLTDDTIVREVRFCQKPNAEPDTRDKQPLVDMVIESLKSDIADGDCTVLDELLMKLPWEILKHSLNEDKWKLVDKLHLTKESIWGEIRNDFEDDEGIVHIDAWLTDDDMEGGTVIAKVNTQTKEVEYLDDRAKTDPYAQEMIQDVLN
jgi:hypothetical protein